MSPAARDTLPDTPAAAPPPLLPWMRRLLQFAGCYNLLVGLSLLVFYHETFKNMGMPRPEPIWPLQLCGLLIGLFGVGYLLVAARPIQNRDLLWLGFWSKLLGPLLSLYHVALGNLPLAFIAVLVFSDLVYLPPFYVIGRRLGRLARSQSSLG